MSVLSSRNLMGQQRLDLPQLRAFDSSVQADLDAILGNGWTGNMPYIINGFTISLTNGPIGLPATQLQIVVAGAAVLNPQASDPGTIFIVPSNRNPELLAPSNINVSGSFIANAPNYIGIDLLRSADATTSDVTSFLATDTNQEIQKIVPTSRTLNYKIYISSTPFSANTNLCPIAKIVTNSNFNVVSITDCRPLLWRLGSGGDVPNWLNFYPFNSGRIENPATTSVNPNPTNAPFVGTNPFIGGDKQLLSMRDWMSAVMTRIWEIGGGPTWYSPSASRFKKLIRLTPPTGSNFTASEQTTTSLSLTWQSLAIIFDNAVVGSSYQAAILNGTQTINVGECLYVDLDEYNVAVRGSSLGPQVAYMYQLMMTPAPSPHGTRFIIAWVTADPYGTGGNAQFWTTDSPFPGGASNQVATTTTFGVVEVNTAPVVASTPVVPVCDTGNTDIIVARGLTRGVVSGILPNLSSGTLTIGGGFYDNIVSISDALGTDTLTLTASSGAASLDAMQVVQLGTTKAIHVAIGNSSTTTNFTVNTTGYNSVSISGAGASSVVALDSDTSGTIKLGSTYAATLSLGNNTSGFLNLHGAFLSLDTASGGGISVGSTNATSIALGNSTTPNTPIGLNGYIGGVRGITTAGIAGVAANIKTVTNVAVGTTATTILSFNTPAGATFNGLYLVTWNYHTNTSTTLTANLDYDDPNGTGYYFVVINTTPASGTVNSGSFTAWVGNNTTISLTATAGTAAYITMSAAVLML